MMKKLLLTTFTLLMAMALNAQSPGFQWMKSNQGNNGNADARYTGLDSSGNVYLIGYFSGTIDFNPSPSQTNWLPSNTNYSWYLQKLNNTGNLIWIRKFDFPNPGPMSLYISSAGRVYIAGEFKDSVDIDPGTGVHKLYSHGGYDAFILKLSANGNFIWAKSFGGPEDEAIRDIVADKQGNVYSHGSYQDTVDFDPGPGICIYGAGYTPFPYNDPLSNAFIQKLDINGNFVWAKAFLNSESTGSAFAVGLGLDDESNIYCTGYFSSIGFDFDPGPAIVSAPANHSRLYFVKLDSSGSFVWARFSTRIGNSGFADPDVLTVDKFNNIIISGFSYLNIDFDPGPDTLQLTSYTFIQKYNQNGDFLWAKSYGYGDDPMALATDTFGNIYTTGMFNDSTDLDPGPDTLMFYTSDKGGYLQKLNTNGDLIWAGILQGNSGYSESWDISVSNNQNIFLSGMYTGTVDFDIGSNVHNSTAYGASFTLKLSQCQTLTTDYQTACDSLTWMDSVTYYQSTQSAYFTLPGAAGCDSVIVLNLNIPQIDTTVSISNYGGSLTANQSGASYQWLDCGSGLLPLSGDTLQSFTPSLNGSYAVAVNVAGCVDTSTCVSVTNAGLQEAMENHIRLYPNPNSGHFTLDLGGLHHADITIVNSMGQVVATATAHTSHTFDLQLPPGVYFLQIKTNDATKNLRFVVR